LPLRSPGLLQALAHPRPLNSAIRPYRQFDHDPLRTPAEDGTPGEPKSAKSDLEDDVVEGIEDDAGQTCRDQPDETARDAGQDHEV
jgi:hypothetical protein